MSVGAPMREAFFTASPWVAADPGEGIRAAYQAPGMALYSSKTGVSLIARMQLAVVALL